MNGSGAIIMVPYGSAAVGALGGAIRAAQSTDALAPVTVVIPSAHVGVSVRRHLARLAHDDGRAGLVNVSWVSLPQLAEQLAASELVAVERPPLTDTIRRAAIRGALDHDPGRFAPVVDNPSTERRLDLTFTELRELEDGELEALAALGGRSSDLVRLFRGFRARCAPFADEREALDRATSAVASGAAPLDAVGPVVAYVPTRLSRAERGLLVELARAGRLTVLLGLTGDTDADASTDALAHALATDLDAPAHRVEVDPSLAAFEQPPSFVRAPDAEEEVRVAVRRVLQALDEGLRPEDIALVSRIGDPYTLLVHEQLTVAGVPHHAPSSVSLAQSVAGRALLGFLALAQRDFRRHELFRWVRSAPIRRPDGTRVPSRFDALARRAGVARGIDQWRQRLERLGIELERDPEHHERDLALLDDLRAFIDGLVTLATPPASPSWSAFATWAESVLDGVLGGRAHADRWPDAERDTLDLVRASLGSLATLDAVQPHVDLARFHRVLEQELERPTHAVGSFGHGVFVGRVGDLAGARHELVLVLGMAEGIFPPSGSEDALLPDDERRSLGGALPDRRPSRADEQRSLLAALSAAPVRQLSFARVDGRGQRETMPSRLYLHELSRVAGTHIGFDDLDGLAAGAHLGQPVAARFTDVPSFQFGAVHASPAVSTQEVAVAALLRGAAPEAALRPGFAAVADRAEGRFSEWTGLAGPEHAPRFTGDRVGSSTSFEVWAGCPFRYFLGQVLGVRPLDTYADADAISGLDRGSLVHNVLEVFIDENKGRAPEQPWRQADRERVRAIATDVAATYETQGRTGRPLLWQLELESLLRRLEIILDVDTAQRSVAGVEPMAVEFLFGIEGGEAPPVDFVLSSGRVVSFRGAIDRIDRDPSSGRLVVLDYKTGKSSGYEGIDDDITCQGRHLQLVIYSEAARRFYGGDIVDAYYWFVEQKESTLLRGATIDDDRRTRFLAVLEVIVDGIERGHFPANPGVADFFGFSHCGYCDYQRVCPTNRDDVWEGVRLSGALADYVALADPDPASEDEATPTSTPTVVGAGAAGASDG
jgi:ATP-dependent helicase/nuclease subunit B